MRFFNKNYTTKLNQTIADFTVVSLLVSIFSGIVISYHYFYTDPLLSVIRLETEIPFGKFFRNLHYFSSQLALIFVFLHLLDSLIKGWHERKSGFAWFWLVTSFLIIIFLVFTGYILRFDEVGKLAGSVAENLSLSLPFIGTFIRDLFFPISKGGLYRVYLAHLYLSFILALGIFVWHSSLRRFLSFRYSLYLYINLALPLFCYVPLKPEEGKKVVTGPWFFLGVQKLLEYLSPPMVILYLSIPIIGLFLFPLKSRVFSIYRKVLTIILIAWLMAYLFLCLWMYGESV